MRDAPAVRKKETAMADFDLVIRNGTVATASDTTQCDVAIKDGMVAALGRNLAPDHGDLPAGQADGRWYRRLAGRTNAAVYAD